MNDSIFKKTLFLILTILLLSASLLMAMEELPQSNNGNSIVYLIITAIVAIYELIVRLIPKIANWSILGLIIDLLKKLSDILTRGKKKKQEAEKEKKHIQRVYF